VKSVKSVVDIHGRTDAKMLTIDGSYGEGGGQILRTALALSLVTGKPFRIERIRANRRKPGLGHQHLTAVTAAAQIGQADVTGNALGSLELTFTPRAIQPGRYHFNVGTAGSCTLVLQTILPALLKADRPSEILLEGGTHNPLAPSFDFLTLAFLPLLNRMGAHITGALERPGFYPAGGGRCTFSIEPMRHPGRLDLVARGTVLNQYAMVMLAKLPHHIAEREIRVLCSQLSWEPERLSVVDITNAQGPGNVVTVVIACEHITEVFTGYGERGVPAEKVAGRAVAEAQEFLTHDAPVGRHLADQLIIPLVLAGGGKFRTFALTPHTITNLEVVKQFLDRDISAIQRDSTVWEIVVGPS